MKKLLFIIVALVITNSAFSQGFKFGFKAGGNLSNMSTVAMAMSGGGMSMNMDVFKNDGMNIGFHAGLFANLSLGSMFGVQPEVLFSMQGGKQKLNSEVGGFGGEIPEGADIAFNYVFDYINVPVLFEFKPIAGLGILVGPQVGFNIYKSQTTTLKLDGTTISETTLKNAELEDSMKATLDENPYKKIDVALVFGVQYSIWKLHVGVRYNIGLTNSFSVEHTEPGMKAQVDGMKNSALQLSIGYSLF